MREGSRVRHARIQFTRDRSIKLDGVQPAANDGCIDE
jgi:hypothetical protein